MLKVVLCYQRASQISNGTAHSTVLYLWKQKGWFCSLSNIFYKIFTHKVSIELAFWAPIRTLDTFPEVAYDVRPWVDLKQTVSIWLNEKGCTLFTELQTSIFYLVLNGLEIHLNLLNGVMLFGQDHLLKFIRYLDHFLGRLCIHQDLPSYCASKSIG